MDGRDEGWGNACEPVEWNLLLVGTVDELPENLSERLGSELRAAGGWILSRGTVGKSCAELDFEFPRHRCVEIYAALVAYGIALSMEAHLELTSLCQCTQMIAPGLRAAAVRVQLAVYSRAGAEDFLAVVPGEEMSEAA